MDSTQIQLREQVLRACRRLLSQINRDAAMPTCGCFDRRYWAWKTIDFPEATFQRNLAALAWLIGQPETQTQRAFYSDVVRKGLLYTTRIQHKNGSFDQAYPYEASYGATGFLLPDLLDAYLPVREECSGQEQTLIEDMLARSADFLYKKAELHGTISNHLAGASLGLLKAAQFFKKEFYAQKALDILEGIISTQSPEGWYVEYGGADPGYQSLCMDYLAQVYQIKPHEKLRGSLESSLAFLQYFIHPDGSFGGEYGSRRTEVYYPGGIALLSNEFPTAAAMSKRMLASIAEKQTVTLDDIDMGNTAPLLNSTIKALEAKPTQKVPALPCEQKDLFIDFPHAGLSVRSTEKYYCVNGSSNGGVLKLFDKKESRLVLDDCGLLAETGSGLISTQFSTSDPAYQADEKKIELEGDFYRVTSSLPSPFKFLLLRLMNLTVMHIGFLNELVKKLLVRMLISGSRKAPLHRKRAITFNPASVQIEDEIVKTSAIKVQSLRYGGKFSSIHMASARYFTPAQLAGQETGPLDVRQLNKTGMIKSSSEIKF